MATTETRSTVRAEARYVRAAPRKTQLIVDQIRGRPVPEARAILAFMTRDAARDVRRVLDSAVANAEANHGLAGDELVVSTAYVGAGPVLKRWRARARGRVGRIRKRTSHITIMLALPTGAEIPAPIERPAPVPAPPEEPVADEAAPEEAEAEEKPTRARKPKTKAEPAEGGAPPEAEEKPKPKRKRAAKPKAEAESAKAEKPEAPAKPKTTRKKTTETDETDEGGES